MSKIEKKKNQIRKKKSTCWLFYTKNDRGGICRICQKLIIANGNTTNLLNHLKRKHKTQWKAAKKQEDNSKDTHMELEEEEDQEDESIELHRSAQEAHQQGLAYQSSDGRTVIWLHPDVQLDQLSSALQPQISLVEHSPSFNNSEEATEEVSGDKDGTAILEMEEELTQKEEDTVSCDEVVQKADTTDEGDSLVISNEEGIEHEDDIITGNVAQIVTVSSSEDPPTKDKSVSSSPLKVGLANLVTSDTSKIKPGNKKTKPSNIMLGNSTNTPSLSKGTVMVSCTPSFKPILPKPEWIPFQMVGQPQMNGVVQNKSSVQSKRSILKKTSDYSEQNSAGQSGEQNSASSSGGQNRTNSCGSCGKKNEARKSQKETRRTHREDSFDHFGKYIATLLRDLPSKKSASRLQKEMLNWVLKEQMLYED